MVESPSEDLAARRPVLITAAMVVDAEHVRAAPGALLLEGDRVLAAGTPESIGPVEAARRIDRPASVVMPALVNAHAHLDLSHVGPVPFGGDFPSWVEGVRSRRASDDEAIAASVVLGVRLARAGGTALVGDVAGAGSSVPTAVLRELGLGGVSYLEVFGLGSRQAAAVDRLAAAVAAGPLDAGGVRLGAQPHAPYSCGPEVYRAATRLGVPLATHLAETPEEIELITEGGGEMASLLRRIGVWDDAIAGTGLHPVDFLEEVLRAAPWLVAHANYLEPRHPELLASVGATVAYCPRASAYFGHPRDGRPAHPYRSLIGAGVRVALGTDSLLCLDTPDRISVLDEMRLLHRRDGTDPRMLLRMATVAGATALGADPDDVTFRRGPTAGIISVEATDGGDDGLAAALRGEAAPSWVHGPVGGDR